MDLSLSRQSEPEASPRSSGTRGTESRGEPPLPLIGETQSVSASSYIYQADEGRRAVLLKGLQRSVGNSAVQRMMAGRSSAPVAPAVQRQNPTVHINDVPMADAEQEKIRLAARAALPIWADTFANLWYTANNGALGVLPEPADPDFESAQGSMAKVAFGTALAGNLVWAASCLMPPTAAAAIAAMSFGGAAAGSGAVPVVAGGGPTATQPSFKSAASGALAKARDRIAAASKDAVRDAANDCAVDNQSDVEEWKQRLWKRMFTTAYNQAAPIQEAAATRLGRAAPQFVEQWRTHKHSKEVRFEATSLRDLRIAQEGYPTSVWIRSLWEPSGPGGPMDQYRLQIYNEEWIKYAASTFKPVLNF